MAERRREKKYRLDWTSGNKQELNHSSQLMMVLQALQALERAAYSVFHYCGHHHC